MRGSAGGSFAHFKVFPNFFQHRRLCCLTSPMNKACPEGVTSVSSAVDKARGELATGFAERTAVGDPGQGGSSALEGKRGAGGA